MSLLTKLIFLAMFILLISGCISLDSSSPKKTTDLMPTPTGNRPPPIQTSTPNVNQHSTMSFTEFDIAMMSKDLTTLQKENLYVNKIFRWDGQVTDVTQDAVIIDVMRYVDYRNTDDVTNYYQKQFNYYSETQTEEFKKIMEARNQRAKIRLLVSDDQKTQLNSLSKDSIITFEGTMTTGSIDSVNNYYWKKKSGIVMYNGKITDYILIVIS